MAETVNIGKPQLCGHPVMKNLLVYFRGLFHINLHFAHTVTVCTFFSCKCKIRK